MLWQHIIHCRGRFYKEEFRETAGRLLSPLLAYFFSIGGGSPALAGEQGLTERHAILYSKGMNYSRKEEHLHMTLRELEAGKSAVIRRVGGEGALRQHFLDMGMIPGAEVTVVKLAPMGDPMEVQGPWLRADASSGGGRSDRHRADPAAQPQPCRCGSRPGPRPSRSW